MNPVVFKTYDIRGVADRDFPSKEVECLGRALGTFFLDRGECKAIVGRDNRRHSPRISGALIQGILATGCDVVDIGQTVTPVFYFAHFYYQIGAGVMVTASHNPPQDNGFKIFCGDSTIYGEDIQTVRRILEQGRFYAGQGILQRIDPEEAYIKYITSRINPLRKLKVAIDAGNGTAGELAVRLFTALGCEVVPLYCESDPEFPHHHPDPTIPENLTDLKELVLLSGADVGLGFDGDGDRLGVINDRGEILWGDLLQILFWREILPKYPAAPAIVEVKCSQALVEEIERLGGRPFFYKTGHSLIKAKMKEIRAPFTGEMSGHFFFADEYLGFDDALYAGARLIRFLSRESKSLSELLADVPRYYATPEIRIPCPEEKKTEVVAGIAKIFSDRGHEIIDIDGARIIFPDGWALVRASNTQPVLVARCEAKTRKALERISQSLSEALSYYPIGQYCWKI
ncbi:phosphomannomutase/phosphoglucomutase [Neomoorella thermoacetica]|uniref:phosphomannomutase/phosphoglucomutase n=1 Tax=Neomoorella thermoacetica TaxID=1525 RepID=UPI0009173E5E|nr:phosphomannomutase/phosphoglucomutase [Moorella thermoacetica]OIQ60440.1 phosphomannomutase/phosphoglucomutase [Moorella thermoacetica]